MLWGQGGLKTTVGCRTMSPSTIRMSLKNGSLVKSGPKFIPGYFFLKITETLLNFFHLSLVALGLCGCAQAFSSCSQQGLLFFEVHELLLTVGSRCTGFCSCDSWARVQAVALQSMCNLPAPGIEPVSPALADQFISTAPPGKSLDSYVRTFVHLHRP